MPLNKKSNLSRFKKTMQGITEFAALLEQSDPKHREDIIEQVKNEDPEFLNEVMKKVVFFEELVYLDEGILSEILSKTSPKILSFALFGMADEFRKVMFRHLSHVGLKAVFEEEEMMNKAPDAAFILGARKQILKIARTLEKNNKFILELHNAPRFSQQKKAL